MRRSTASCAAAVALVFGALFGASCTCSKGHDEAPRREAASRVASQTILSDELLWSLGSAAQGRVVALSPLVDDPRYSTVVGRWSPAIPRLAGSSEALLARDPQLVILASFTAAETRAFLEAHRIELLTLEGFRGFDDLWGHIRAIAAAIGEEAAGERLIRDLQGELAALHAASEAAAGPPLTAVSWGSGFVAGAGTTFDDIARTAGLTNLAADRGLEGHAPLATEALVAWDPEVLVLSCEPANCPAIEAEFAARPGIRAIRAAREGRVYAIPGAYLTSTGAGMIVAARLLAERRRRPPINVNSDPRDIKSEREDPADGR